MPLPSAAKMILHLVPVESFTASLSMDVRELQTIGHLAHPLGKWGWHQRFNMDGIVIYGGGQLSENEPLSEQSAYTQIFRNGILEVVQNGIKYPSRNSEQKTWLLRTQTIEPGLVKAIPRYLQSYETLGISPPVWCFLTLTDVEGVFINREHNYEWRPPIERPDLFLPEILIEDLKTETTGILRPLFDMIWNSADWPRSLNFDEKGNWIGQ